MKREYTRKYKYKLQLSLITYIGIEDLCKNIFIGDQLKKYCYQ